MHGHLVLCPPLPSLRSLPHSNRPAEMTMVDTGPCVCQSDCPVRRPKRGSKETEFNAGRKKSLQSPGELVSQKEISHRPNRLVGHLTGWVNDGRAQP